MTDWQPIETVPKDGTVVDLWIIPPDKQISSGPCRIINCWFAYGRWRTYNDNGDEDCWVEIDWKPTHWMPLPEPPKETTPLSKYTDEEIAAEYFQRAQKQLGDPRTCVSSPPHQVERIKSCSPF